MKKFIKTLIIISFLSSVSYADSVDFKIFDFTVNKESGKNFIKSVSQNNSDISDDNVKPVKNTADENNSVKSLPDIEVSENDGLYIIKIDTKKVGNLFQPYYVTHLTTNREVFDNTNARLVINAGFFDPKNHQTVSYLTLNGKTILDPHNNKNLMGNKYLEPYMDKILNRSELRVLKSKTDDSLLYDIAPHNEPVPRGYELIHAIQGGPALAPVLRLEEEFFVITDDEGKIISQSASCLSKYARTLIGIKNNNIYFVIATKSRPITLIEASDIMKAAGFSKAMAYDGGGSVSLDYRDKDIHIVSDKNETARKLKSFWVVLPENSDSQN